MAVPPRKRYKPYLFDDAAEVPRTTIRRRVTQDIDNRRLGLAAVQEEELQNRENVPQEAAEAAVQEDELQNSENILQEEADTDLISDYLEARHSDSSSRHSLSEDEGSIDSVPLSISEDDEEDDDLGEEFWLTFDDNVPFPPDADKAIMSEKIYDGCEISIGEGVYKFMELFLRHSCTKEFLSDWLLLIQDFLPKPNKFPKTKHFLRKFLKIVSPSIEVKKHAYCQTCMYYLGEFAMPLGNNNYNCPVCNDTSEHGKPGIFVEYPLHGLLKSTFEKRHIYKYIDSQPVISADDSSLIIQDITTGKEYLKLKDSVIRGRYDISLLINTDGVPVFESSNAQLWPVQLIIPEIPYQIRSQFLLVCGLWYGTKKPEMNTFLRPFAQSLSNLEREGVSWKHPRLNKVFVSKVVAPIISVDAPARAAMQNTHQFNGSFGCSLCEHEGQSIKKNATGRGRCRVYPLTHPMPPLRIGNTMQLLAEQAVTEGVIIKGIKGPTVLSLIPHLDIASGFIPDYMHCVLQGVTRQKLSLMLDSCNSNEQWYIGLRIKDLDRKLLGIKPPDIIARAPRSLTLRKFWKASEYRSWLLYYSIPVLQNILPCAYFQHWLLLVSGIYILLMEKISVLECDLAQTLLNIYVEKLPTLYGLKNCSFNVHSLLHLPQSVKRWGPLWATSAFGFENNNGLLLKLVHGTQSVDMQLVNTMDMIHATKVLSDHVFAEKAVTLRVNNTVPIGTPLKGYVIRGFEKKVIEDTVQKEIGTNYKMYLRCKIRGEMFKSVLYKKDLKRNSYTICFTNNNSSLPAYGAIKYFLEFENKEIVCVVNKLCIERNNFIIHRDTTKKLDHIIPIVESHMVQVVLPHNVQCKVIRMHNFVCLRPNTKEVNL